MRIETGSDSRAQLGHALVRVTLRMRLEPLDQRLEGRLRVADQRQCRIAGADALGCGVDLDQLSAEAQLVLGGRLSSELGSHTKDGVRAGQQLLEGALVTSTAGGERVVVCKRTLAHVGGRDRRVEQLGKDSQLPRSTRSEHASTAPDDRSIGGAEKLRGRLECDSVRERSGQRNWGPTGVRRSCLAGQHVDRKLDVNRSARGCQRDVPCLGDEAPDRAGVWRSDCVLDDRREHRELIGQLVQVATPAPDQLARQLA